MGASRRWHGARWQFDLMAPDAPPVLAAAIDATTTAQGHAWAVSIQDHLRAQGHGVRAQTDQGEDGRGNPVTYEALIVEVGDGYMSVAFFRDLILWTVDVAAADCDGETFQVTARAVLAAIETVSGWSLAPAAASSDERMLLGRA
ncbi:hypothetical protein [Cellulomonas soli]